MYNLEMFQKLRIFDMEVYKKCNNSNEIIKRFEILQKEGRTKGFTPVIVSGIDLILEKLELSLEDQGKKLDRHNFSKYISDIIKKSRYIDAQNCLEERLKDCDDEELEYEFEDKEDSGFIAKDSPIQSISSFLDFYTGKPQDEVAILKLPTTRPYEALAYLPIGGFNDCPEPCEMVSVCKYWYENYGAYPVALSYDVVEFIVSNPPTEKEDVDNLAFEHMAFCMDIVEQGVGSLRQLAMDLNNSEYWYFWWD